MLQSYGAPPVRVALDVMSQVADGLADAHAVGLIHRDIKPANVLLRRRENSVTAYLSDFGIARQVSADPTQSRTGTIGTPSYMAPELHTGGTASVASDVYSLGCLLWATITGRAPYTGTTEYQVVSAHVEQPIPQLPEDGPLATEVNRILRTAMAKQPAERYSSVAELRDDVRRARGLPDAATPADASTSRLDVRSRRSVGVLVVGLLILLALLAGGVSYALVAGDEDEPSADPTSSPAGSQTPSPTDPTSPATGSSTAPTGSDEEVAIANVARAFEEAGTMTSAQAECAAEQWVRTAGLQAMIDAGLFDEDLAFHDKDISEMPDDVRQAITTAALSCGTAT
jgi:serine/threonine-protein kinase